MEFKNSALSQNYKFWSSSLSVSSWI